jgi:hypothetical protein
LLRQIAYKCVVCRRKLAKPTTQMMAPLPFFWLPSSRLHPFDHAAVDVAGSFVAIQNKLPLKRWLLVIRCATTGAVHLEMIDSMDTSSFLLAIERFIAIRPRPTVFLADNGTNFRGREADLKEKNQINITEAQRKLNIEFRFAPPRAPHHMGLVERIVGAAKAALRPALRTTSVSSEELRTVFAKTMGILNNFSIAYMVQSDIDFHYRPLTANHFLMRQPYSELQEQNTGSISAAKRYRKLNEIRRVFWTKLVTELTTHLRQYNTWIEAETRGVKLNDIALLLDPNKRGLLPLVLSSSLKFNEAWMIKYKKLQYSTVLLISRGQSPVWLCLYRRRRKAVKIITNRTKGWTGRQGQPGQQYHRQPLSCQETRTP